MAVVPALLRQSALTLLPVLALVSVAGVLASLAQTGLVVRAEGLAPQLARINPGAALKRILGPEGVAELVRTLTKLALVGAALWQAVDIAALQAALHQPAALVLREAGRGALRLLLAALGAAGAIALLDLLWVRWRHLRKLRMSREELRRNTGTAKAIRRSRRGCAGCGKPGRAGACWRRCRKPRLS